MNNARINTIATTITDMYAAAGIPATLTTLNGTPLVMLGDARIVACMSDGTLREPTGADTPAANSLRAAIGFAESKLCAADALVRRDAANDLGNYAEARGYEDEYYSLMRDAGRSAARAQQLG